MKSKILLVIGILTYPVYGQESDESYYSSKSELSIVVDDIFAKNTYVYPSNLYYPTPFSLYSNTILEAVITPKIGMGYKFHFIKSAIHSKISVGYRNETVRNKYDTSTAENSLLTSGISFGYELHKNMNRTQLFYGVDMFINYSKLNSKSTNFYNSEKYISERIYNMMGYGISPLIGVKYFLGSSISVSTELKYSIEAYNGKNVSRYTGDTGDDIDKISGTDTKFGPLGQISLNIHF